MKEDTSIYCPGGYRVRALRTLCGRSGNQCHGDCAYAWREPDWWKRFELEKAK